MCLDSDSRASITIIPSSLEEKEITLSTPPVHIEKERIRPRYLIERNPRKQLLPHYIRPRIHPVRHRRRRRRHPEERRVVQRRWRERLPGGYWQEGWHPQIRRRGGSGGHRPRATGRMSIIMTTLWPRHARECWGSGWTPVGARQTAWWECGRRRQLLFHAPHELSEWAAERLSQRRLVLQVRRLDQRPGVPHQGSVTAHIALCEGHRQRVPGNCYIPTEALGTGVGVHELRFLQHGETETQQLGVALAARRRRLTVPLKRSRGCQSDCRD